MTIAYRHWTNIEERTLAEYRAAGLTCRAIAQKLGRTHRSIERRCLGLRIMSKRISTKEERAEVVRLYSQGVMLKQLAHLFNRDPHTINEWVRKASARRGHKFRLRERA